MSNNIDNVTRTISAGEDQLNNLFKEVLDGLRDDIEEAKDNVLQYIERIEKDPQSIDLYGSLLNQALSVKGSVRDKQLKFLNTFKDRVTKKEAIELAKGESKQGGMNIDITAMNKEIENLIKGGQLERLELDDEDDES